MAAGNGGQKMSQYLWFTVYVQLTEAVWKYAADFPFFWNSGTPAQEYSFV